MEFKILRSIGEELRKLRKYKDLPLSEVAEHVGVSSVYISEIERDKKVPSDEVISKLADIYNIEELNLFEGFGRIPEFMSKEITDNPCLFELLFKLASNEKISKEQKEKFYTSLNEMYDKMF